jgi:hypothetical protein
VCNVNILCQIVAMEFTKRKINEYGGDKATELEQ